MSWKVDYYESEQGDTPIYDFIEGLELKARGKVYYALELLKEYGIHIGLPHVKKLTGTDLWELRIVGADNIRIFYITVKNKTFLLLHGFLKKKQKTPQKETNTALSRLQEFLSRGQK